MSTERRVPASDGQFRVGLVGRTGSGKSTLARFLAARGARVVEGDAIGHQVTDRDPEVRRALIAEYGPRVYGAGGALDRARVAARVFADPAARERLDRLVHPRIVAAIRERLAALRAEGFRGMVVLDAALLLEWGLEREVDAVVAVTAPEEDRVARLAASRGWSPAEARRRLAAQRPDEGFRAAADVVVENAGGSRAALEERAHAALAELDRIRDARERAARTE